MRSFIFIALLTGITACRDSNTNNEKKQADTAGKRLELPEPDKDLREQNEALQKLTAAGCIFADPDTTLAGIKLRDPKSTVAVTGNDHKPDDNDQYHFYAANKGEILTLTQHAGDGKFAISIFKVAFADKPDYGYPQLNTNTFQTEKGIRTGMTRQQVIDKLGPCYITKDSTKKHMELYYQLAQPNDSKTKLLERHNMPVYYASYRFLSDQLTAMEFGFEYP